MDAVRSRLTVPKWSGWSMLLFSAWIVCSAFTAWHLNQGWVPHDDGAFAQSAQRVLDGQLPHRDFTELYTGGLTFLNAAVFALLGEDLVWLRIPMFALFVAYVPCVYLLVRRFASPAVGVVAALFAVAWGPVTYPAAVPSWYLLFFSVFGALALLKFTETHQTVWLVVGGLFGGLSIGFKIVGIWYVLAAVLFLLFVEQESRPSRAQRSFRLGWYGSLVIATACLTLALVASLLSSHAGLSEFVTFLLPIGAVCGLVLVNELRVEQTHSRARLSSAVRLAVPFLLGVAAPLAVLAVPYLAAGSVGELLSGVLVTPRTRLQDTYLAVSDPTVLVVAAPVMLALVARCIVPKSVRRLIDVGGVILLAILVAATRSFVSYAVLWNAARGLAPFIVVAGCASLAFMNDRSLRPNSRPGLFLMVALAAFMGLVQFPFGAPIYFCFIAPLLAMAAIASLRYAGAGSGALPTALLIAYTLFGFLGPGRGAIYFYGNEPYRNPQTVVLDHRRASIRVTPTDRDVYRRATALLERHGSGGFTYAGPDAPELYFLSDSKNPTRSLFDVLDASSSARGVRLLETLRAHKVTAIAINLHPGFSHSLDAATLRRLRRIYPSTEIVGPFEMRWRPPSG